MEADEPQWWLQLKEEEDKRIIYTKGEALEPWRAHARIQLQHKTNGETSLGFGMDRFKDITVVNTHLLTKSPELAVKSSSILLIKGLNILWVVIT